MAEGNSHLSPMLTALLSAGVAIVISAGVYIFAQGQLQSSVAEETRRITNLEQGTVQRGEMADIDRRIGNLESASPALGSLHVEVDTNGRRIATLEGDISKALTEAATLNAAQDLKIAALQARQEEGLRRLLVLETGTVPPLGDRMQVLTTGAALTAQKVEEMKAEIERLRAWKNQHEDADKTVSVELSRLSQIAKMCRPDP